MSVTKAEFRVLRSIIKAGCRREPGFTFVAGVNGTHVKRWLSEGRVAIVRRVDKPTPAPVQVSKRRPDRVARALGLIILGVGLIVALHLRPRFIEVPAFAGQFDQGGLDEEREVTRNRYWSGSDIHRRDDDVGS